ncbi:4-alpha-glucanotransferase [Phocoenobacter skyensis]|nr:4-alpha-glucanotransferase [Pasteurella skyensis]MDP8079557.1 4-alpha-glucanotransferase [Pasteurella skyensis]MDP8085429.1 4-alpha-glucanotransferase [Pasteurella skyensis]MDP8185844.1 4-alpha-glucanotransferase [Pasteurella skyensis]QLB23655.1 4-alpha-glucanotransferase [Pasteurella skyensis]
MEKEHPYINPYFINERGEHCYPAPEVYQKIATLLGEPAPTRLIPFVKVISQNEAVTLDLIFAKNEAVTEQWQLRLESGEQQVGSITEGKIILPCDLPLGYHTLTIVADGSPLECRIIVTPKTAFQPEQLQQGKKLWGAILQLYTLRSEANWGIGDFGDLQQFLIKIAEQGGDFVGLNPIHSLFPANPEAASPYSPSSRLWQNIIYINVNNIEAFQQSEEAQQWFHSEETQRILTEIKAQPYVNYAQVMQLKLTGLQFAFAKYVTQDQTEFEQFIAEQEESLQVQGTFDALHQWLSEQNEEQWGWDYWAEQYQSYHSSAVQQFKEEHSYQVRFYMWLQFVAQQQLAQCNEQAKQLGMPIGFYRDLAVGVSANGSETWADKELYVLDASVGAPPDIMAPQGQNWGLSPMHPDVLQQRAYQPFIDLLRANMKHCGALRIDHILGFARLWWATKNAPAKDGAYVRYPLEDLLSILALESQRHQCLIIAEALGIVPEGMLDALAQKGILAYNIFYFEFDWYGSRHLHEYPYHAMTTLSTHDLPTVKGYWQHYDFELGEKFGVYPNLEILQKLQHDRTYAKQRIREAVENSGQPLERGDGYLSQQFTHQLQSYVANTNSALFGTQPEDWLNMLEPVNIPGTSNEYPNWRRKLSKTTEEIFADENIRMLLQNINTKRR